jgi:hypothetical protein
MSSTRAALKRRLEALEQAVFLAITPCNCGGVGFQAVFGEEEESGLPEACPVHGPITRVIFRDPTRRPPGYQGSSRRPPKVVD